MRKGEGHPVRWGAGEAGDRPCPSADPEPLDRGARTLEGRDVMRKMGDDRRILRRATFDEVAELYARARPRYPEFVIDDAVELGGLVPGSRIVEIGCG